MPYDFDTIWDRRTTNSMKWDVLEGELPMWVADMDFRTAPEIVSAIKERAEHGIFGYTVVPKEWYRAVSGWWKKRHDFQMEKEWLIFCTGVVPAISSIVRKMTTAGENIIVQTPVYNIFFNSIVNNGRNILENKLRLDGEEYQIDFADLEMKLADPQTTLMIVCNPHNPIGKIWNKETLKKIGELCEKYHVLVISDEVHCDLTKPGSSYIPFASVSEVCRLNSITCLAPTKAFNLAGLQTAAVMVPNEAIRHKVNRGLNTDEVAEPNVFAIDAAIAAFEQGAPWLDALREYLWVNRRFAKDYIHAEIPQIKVFSAEATYLLWLDIRRIMGNSTEFCDFIRRETGLYLSDGNNYRNGEGFLRMNIACPKSMVQDGLLRLKESVLAYDNGALSSVEHTQI
ncbi:MalY/PatB family protein [Luxibacter massiliensis]|uniref:MalY/PatB family protein n=1 Tax=Luxibacter massiliensis TaxID=2219695 RepID=UPI000F06C6C2|nr:MalY/PatB family protein [Luxibacter massiliensis]